MFNLSEDPTEAKNVLAAAQWSWSNDQDSLRRQLIRASGFRRQGDVFHKIASPSILSMHHKDVNLYGLLFMECALLWEFDCFLSASRRKVAKVEDATFAVYSIPGIHGESGDINLDQLDRHDRLQLVREPTTKGLTLAAHTTKHSAVLDEPVTVVLSDGFAKGLCVSLICFTKDIEAYLTTLRTSVRDTSLPPKYGWQRFFKRNDLYEGKFVDRTFAKALGFTSAIINNETGMENQINYMQPPTLY